MNYFEWSTDPYEQFTRYPYTFIDANANATVDPHTNQVVYVITTVPERQARPWRTNNPMPTMTASQARTAWQEYLRKSQKP